MTTVFGVVVEADTGAAAQRQAGGTLASTVGAELTYAALGATSAAVVGVGLEANTEVATSRLSRWA